MSQSYISKLKTINRLIRTKATGTPKQFAKRLSISESSLYMYLSHLKELGAPIAYSKDNCTYYYESGGEFFIGFVDQMGERRNDN